MTLKILWQTALVSALASPAWAAEFVVTNLADDGPGSLRDAVNQANAADDEDTIRFDFSGLPGGGQRVINLTSEGLVLSHPVMIVGPGSKDLIVQRSSADGTPEFRIFDVTFSAGIRKTMISGMTIRGGVGSEIRGGGAVAIGAGNQVRLHDTVLQENTTPAPRLNSGGGAIFNAGQLTITSSQFLNNTATMPVDLGANRGGGAIFNLGTLTIDKSVFSGNNFAEGFVKTLGSGGAIYNAAGGNLTVTNSSFDGNNVSGFGGAISNEVGGTMSLIKNTISDNSATDGGGILNLGTIDQLKSNIISGNTNAPDGAENAPDLGLGFPTTGTINSASGNIVGQRTGHGLDPATNQLGADPNLEPLKDNGGPTPSRKPDPNGPAKDQGDDSVGLRFDQRGFFRKLNGATDVGAVETGNRWFIFIDAMPVAWSDPANWLDGNLPGDGDPAWIVSGNTADLTGAGTITIDSLNVGVSGDVGGAAGSVVGTDISITSDSIDVGSAYGQISPLNSGNGDVSVTNATITSNTLRVAFSEAAGEDVYTIADGSITITSDAGRTSNVSVSGNTSVGTASAFAAGSKAAADGFFRFEGQSAEFGAFFAGESFSSDGGRTTSISDVSITATQNVLAGSLAAASAISGPDAASRIEDTDVGIAADQFTVNGPVRVASAQISAPADGPASAEVNRATYSVNANQHSISNRMSLGTISASTFGPAGTELATARIGTVAGALDVQQLSINSGLEAATIFATGPGENTIEDVSLSINEADSEVSGVVAVGTMFLSNAASGVINSAVLEVIGGTFRVANTPAGFPSLRIGTVDAFTPAGLAQTTAVARFDGVVADFAGSVVVANANVAGADPASSARGMLDLGDSQVSVGGDVILAENFGVAAIPSSATLRSNPSLLSIGGNLRMGPGAELDFLIEGLERPALGLPGEYGAIDAGGAVLDGRLMVDFDFPAVTEGDSFELIRLNPGGLFTGDFDSFSASGLPAGLAMQTLFSGDSFFVEVISAPSMLTGDTNADGRVDIDDLNAVRNNFGTLGPDDGTLAGDAFPFDGLVNIDDLNAVRNNFGAMAAAVPEPSTLVLGLLCCLLHFIAPRRR